MLNKKNKSNKVIGICIFAIAIWSLSNVAAIAQVQETQQANNSDATANYGLPSNREAGGSRDPNCIANGNSPIALIPDQSVNVTASISPRLFFYIPETTEQKTIEFVVRDQNDQLVHELFIETTGQEGIMNVEIPQDISKSLEQSNSNYRWYLSMICDQSKRARDLVLEGWISYVELDNAVKQKIANSNPVEQAELYQQEGVWYDALSVVAEDITQAIDPVTNTKWAEMLESIGLSQLSKHPFIEGQIIE